VGEDGPEAGDDRGEVNPDPTHANVGDAMNLDNGQLEVLAELEADARDLGEPTTELEVEAIRAAYWEAVSECDVHEAAEGRDSYFDDFGNHAGPDRLADDARADSLGRKLVYEAGGA
jgi:hypothetical protein